MQTERRGESKN